MKKNCYIMMLYLVLLMISPSMAVVLHDDGDAPVIRPDNTVMGRWASNGSCVAIGRKNWEKTNYIITTRHQGGGVNSSVYFGGTEYKVVQQWLNGSVDMRICRLETTTGGNANLTNFVQWYTGSSETSANIVVGGFGKGRGASGFDGGSYYEWSGTNNQTQRWGSNDIFGTDFIDVGTYQSDTLVIKFGNMVSGDCATAEWDSGGGWFINTESAPATNWELVALNAYVQHNGKSYYLPSDSNMGIRVGSYASWIDSTVPAGSESPTLILIASFNTINGIIADKFPSISLLSDFL